MTNLAQDFFWIQHLIYQIVAYLLRTIATLLVNTTKSSHINTFSLFQSASLFIMFNIFLLAHLLYDNIAWWSINDMKKSSFSDNISFMLSLWLREWSWWCHEWMIILRGTGRKFDGEFRLNCYPHSGRKKSLPNKDRAHHQISYDFVKKIINYCTSNIWSNYCKSDYNHDSRFYQVLASISHFSVCIALLTGNFRLKFYLI
jgi:hypothetical protein